MVPDRDEKRDANNENEYLHGMAELFEIERFRRYVTNQ